MTLTIEELADAWSDPQGPAGDMRGHLLEDILSERRMFTIRINHTFGRGSQVRTILMADGTRRLTSNAPIKTMRRYDFGPLLAPGKDRSIPLRERLIAHAVALRLRGEADSGILQYAQDMLRCDEPNLTVGMSSPLSNCPCIDVHETFPENY